MPRDIVLRAFYQDLVGDETFELWVQHESDGWVLSIVGEVVVASGHQDFSLFSLVSGDTYTAQIRLKRSGRYRTGYLSGDPDSWPSASRCEFVTGALEGVGAPTINSGTWSRTSSISQKIELNITPDDNAVDIAVYRDDVQIGVASAPFFGAFSFEDIDPTLGAEYAYIVKHIVVLSGLTGPSSNEVDVFSGPLPIAGFVMSSGPTDYGEYEIDWTSDARTYRAEDDYLCVGTTYSLLTGGAALVTGPHTETKEPTALPVGGTQSIFFHCRMRAEVTAFTVTDVSDWTTITITMEIDDPDDDTGFNTCP